MKLANLIFISTFMFLAAFTEISGGPVEGKVIDLESGQPVEGVLVLVKWNTETGGSSGKKQTCYHIESGTTDASGRFGIARWHVTLGTDENGAPLKWLPFNLPSSYEVSALKQRWESRIGRGLVVYDSG